MTGVCGDLRYYYLVVEIKLIILYNYSLALENLGITISSKKRGEKQKKRGNRRRRGKGVEIKERGGRGSFKFYKNNIVPLMRREH